MVTHASRLPRPRVRFILILLACAFLALYYLPSPYTWSTSTSSRYIAKSSAGNETLGFGAIFVLATDEKTWRVQGLRRAAKLVGLDMRIPIQSRPSEDEVYAHMAGDEAHEILNEVRATLNYLSLTDKFLETGYDTALFLEDDADFSMDVRFQMEAVSNAIIGEGGGVEDHSDLRPSPYGESAWDVFWIGHFGVEFSNDTRSIRYNDPVALSWDRLTSDFNNLYEVLRDSKEKEQQIVTDVAPMATYGFALTRHAAQMLTERLRADRAQKFDLALHILCKGQQLRCWAPLPEIVHHHSALGMKTIRLAGEDKGDVEDISWWQNHHKFTWNIEYSARCNALRVGEKLGDRYQCLPGRYDKNY